MRIAVLGGALAIALSASAPALGLRTLVDTPREIRAFAQDGQFVSWIARMPNGWAPICGRTFIRSLATGKQRSFGTRTRPVCGGEVALGRGRALWTGDPGICGNCIPARVSTAALSDPVIKHLGTFIYLNGGDQLTGLAADQRLLAFSWVRYTQRDEPDCLNESVPCAFDRTGGRLTRVVGREKHDVPVIAPPALLAVGGGRLAIARTADSWQGPENPQPVVNGPVEIIDPTSGAVVMTVSPAGTARLLAVSSDALAVLLEKTDGSFAIERYAIPGGALLASTTVSARAARGELDIEGKWIVYRDVRQIRLVDAAGADFLLHRARGRPFDVSIEGRRVAWVENTVAYHRILALLAPR